VTATHAPARRTVFLPGAVDDLAAAHRLVSCGLVDSYVVYERPGARWLAANVMAELVAGRELVTATTAGQTVTVPLGPRPIRCLGDLAAAWPPAWRAYGYLAFELGQLLHGGVRPALDGPPLAHLVVPELEVQWTAAGTTIRCADAELLRRAVEVLRETWVMRAAEPAPLPLAPPDDRDRYQAAVADATVAIARGRLRKAVVSRRLDVPFPVDLPATYALGVTRNTAARTFLLDLGGRRAAGFCPETVVEVRRDGLVRTQPLAGTRPAGAGGAETRCLREELRWDPKECYEHVISVRLACEEMRAVCDYSSIAVRDLMTVKERGPVQHLASTVTGRLAGGRDPWDALEALFPAVTASGVPKAAALDLIAGLEGGERGLYAGVVCMVDGLGDLDGALVLRSVFQDGGRTWLHAGAGIVAGSEPAREFEETTAKLRSAAGCLVRAAAAAPVEVRR